MCIHLSTWIVYLGAEIAGDCDHSITIKHRCKIATGRFGEYRTVLKTTSLPQRLKLRLYGILIVSTMAYGSSAWLFVDSLKRTLNGIN